MEYCITEHSMLRAVVRAQTLTQRAAEQLEELILSGKLKPGDRLPAEAEMGEMLGVSRTVVREAVRQLSAKGLLEVRNGAGVFARSVGSSVMREPINLLLRSRTLTVNHIVEVRSVLEVHLAGLAAERAGAQDLAAMQAAIDKLDRSGLTPAECAQYDVEFHACLAAAAGNPLFAVLAESVNAVMLDPIRFVYERSPEAQADTVREHTHILACIRARDAEGARKAMLASLKEARYTWDGYPERDATSLATVKRPAKRARKRGQAQCPGS